MRLDLNSHVIVAIRFCTFCVFAALLAIAMSGAASAQNLLRNGDFGAGTGNNPSYWHTLGWIDLPSTKYIWLPPEGGDLGLVSTTDQLGNDAAWTQSLHLDPGWYYVGAQAKALCASSKYDQRLEYGALISLADVGVVSPDLVPSSDYQELGLYVKVGPLGADVQVQLRLVCPVNYDVGQAFFRAASVVKVDSPMPRARSFDLDEVRSHFGGKPRSLLLLAAGLAIGALAGWMILPESF